MNKDFFFRIDWITLLIYLLLVLFGMFNIYSISYENTELSIYDINNSIGKQFWFFIFCLFTGIPIIFLKPNFFDNISFLSYVICIVLLAGLFVFGSTIKGITAWYKVGAVSMQPSEFAKLAVALMISSYLSFIQNDIKNYKTVLKIILIIFLPLTLILLQPDLGTAIIFTALIFVLIREGLSINFFLSGLYGIILFLTTLIINPLNTSLILIFGFLIFIFILRNRAKKNNSNIFILTLLISVIYCFSVNYIFNEIFEQRHRDRISVVLGEEVDPQGIGYNINQSKIAIGSGGLLGKGFLNGTQTKGKFVPEQDTDFIFTTVSEEWGFLGSASVIILFNIMILRIIYRAEKHTKKFNRIFSYCFASFLCFHFIINIGMTIGLIPTIGIPLPFISYGGSNLLTFSVFLMIYLNLDANRLN